MQNIEEIKAVINEIKTTYSTKFETIKKEKSMQINKTHDFINSYTKEKHDLEKKIKHERNKNQELIAERNRLANIVKEENSEIELFENENNQIKHEIKELKNYIMQKKEGAKELENECDELNRKIDFKETQRKNKEHLYKINAEKIKKAFNFDIIVVKKNVLKIIFGNSYLIIDFEEENCITDCFPSFMMLEKLNQIYKNSEGIYDFIKWIRKEFQKQFYK